MAEIVVHFSRDDTDDDCLIYCIFDADGKYLNDGAACDTDSIDWMIEDINRALNVQSENEDEG